MAQVDTGTARIIELALRVGGVFLVIYLVLQIVAPFIPAVAWAVIIAVAAHPAYAWLRDHLGGRAGLSASVVTGLFLLLLILPAAWLASEAMTWSAATAEHLRDGTLKIQPPPEKVSTWPVVGPAVHEAWALASTNLSEAVRRFAPQLRTLAGWLLPSVAGAGAGLLQFALSIAIAGVLLANSRAAGEWSRSLFARIMPARASDFSSLCEATIRSVATGVIGVALIQAALIGVALVAIGLPGAPIWIIAIVLLGIVQLPASLVTVPCLIWVWGSHDALPATLFTVWVIPAGLADNVLKPLLLGRGVAAPMLVIFLGAIGGFIAAGIIGLFVGAVVLVLAYELFQAWLEGERAPQEPS